MFGFMCILEVWDRLPSRLYFTSQYVIFFFFFFWSLGVYLCHVEVPRLGVKSVCATVVPDLSHICNLHLEVSGLGVVSEGQLQAFSIATAMVDP